jgi:glycosyltransferase involved in cell wall biosynthesis
MIDSGSPALSIVVPALNEASALRTLVPELRASFPDAEIIIVDDGSTDTTSTICTEELCKLVKNPYRMGNGAAIKRGARAATGDLLAFLDGDGQHTPEHLKTLLNKFRTGDFDMVIGARPTTSQASSARRFGNHFLNRLASWMTGQTIPDLTSGLRVVKTHRFREFLHLLPNGFSYPTTVTMAFFRSGYSVAYVPVGVQQRVGRSHIRIVRDGARFLLIIFKIGSLYSPLKLFVPISVALFGLASALYAYTFFSSGRFTNMSAVIYMTSLFTLLIGLVSEQITNLMFARRER